MKLTINNLDLTYSIDTYNMFNPEGLEDAEKEYYQELYNLTDNETDSLGFNYNHPEVVKGFAEYSVQLLHENLVQHGDGIVKDIKLKDTTSPKFYNYTTDNYTAEWTIDPDKLETYCETGDNRAYFGTFVRNNWYSQWHDSIYDPAKSVEMHQRDKEMQAVIMLDFYTRNEYEEEKYNISMWEAESELWVDHMDLDEESQKLIKSKGSKQ